MPPTCSLWGDPTLGITAAHPQEPLLPQEPLGSRYFCMKQHSWLSCCCFWAAQPCLLAVSCLVRPKASRQLLRRASQARGCMFVRDFLRRRCPGGPVLLGRRSNGSGGG